MSLLTVWLTTFGVALLSALVPVVNIEIYLLGASALAPSAFVVPLVIAATAGQMLGKTAMYYMGMGALKLPGTRWKVAMEKVNSHMEQHPRMGGALVFASASVGLPPFYIMSVAAGAARMNLAWFIVLGSLGRLIRFGVIVAVPQLVKEGLIHW